MLGKWTLFLCLVMAALLVKTSVQCLHLTSMETLSCTVRMCELSALLVARYLPHRSHWWSSGATRPCLRRWEDL